MRSTSALFAMGLSACHPRGDAPATGAAPSTPADTDEPDEMVATPLVADRDGDGFGFVSDCDDADPSVYPGAHDVCGDGISSDCGRSPPCRYEGEWSVANAHRIVGTRTGEGAGEVIVGAGDTNGDGLADFLSYSQGGAGLNLVLGPADIATFDEAAASIPDTFSGLRPPVGAGDLDADGYDDVLVTTRTSSYVLSGPLSGIASAEDDASAQISFLMTSAASAGDWDGDGQADLAFSWSTGDMSTVSTALVVVSGPFHGEISPESATFTVRASVNGRQLGEVTGGGDYDADGLSDVVASMDMANVNGDWTGAAWLFYGGETGEQDIDDADAVMAGVKPEERAAYSTDSAGDINADGYDDIVIGSFTQDVNWGYRVNQTAVASVVYGPVYGQLDLDQADARYECDEEPISCAGAQVRGAGDMDGDGFDDFVVANPVGWREGGSHGGAWLFYGPVEGQHTIDVADAALVGDVPVLVGTAMDGVGDLDGDGLDDLVLGTPWWREAEDSTAIDLGIAYVVFGGAL